MSGGEAARPGNGPQHEGSVGPYCDAGDSGYLCTAARGHIGPHMAYGDLVSDKCPRPILCHSWPQDGTS